MNHRSKIFIAAAVLAVTAPLSAQAGNVVLAGYANSGTIYHVDPFTGREWFGGPFSDDFSGFTTYGVTALAIHPQTRDVYVVFDTDELYDRLVRYDGRSFQATDIGNLGEFIVGLAFDSNGTLYGITSDDVQGTTDTIFTINTTTGALTYFMDTPGPDDFNDTIAYNPVDGRLYHSNGFPGSFQAINLTTKAVTSIGLPGNWPANVGIRSFTYDTERGLFVGYRQQEFGADKEYFTLGGGVQTTLATGTFDATGMIFLDDPPLTPPTDPSEGRFLYGVDANVNLVCQVDPATGEDLGAIGVLLDGEAVSGFNGLATDPTNGEMYAVARLDVIDQRLIVKIDPSTGVATTVGDTGDAIAGIAFDSAGTLYAVTGDGATTPSTIFTVDKATGALTQFLALSDNGAGEAIAFNPDDGKMYRFSGNTSIEAIDLGTKGVTVIAVSGDTAPNGPPSAATYDDVEDKFLVMRWGPDQVFYTVTAAGVQTTVDPATEPRKGFAFSLPVPTTPYGAMGTLDGTGEIAIVRRDNGTNNFRYVRIDVSTGSVETNTMLGSPTTLAKDFLTVPDLTGDGIGDFVLLTVDEGGGPYQALVRDGATGGAYGVNNHGTGTGFEWFGLVAVGGAAGPGTWGIGAHGVNTMDGRTRVQVKDPDTGSLIGNVEFSRHFDPFGAAVLPDRNMNDVQEIVTFNTRVGGSSLMQIKDGLTGALLGKTFLSSIYDPIVDFSVIPDIDGGGDPELAILANRQGDTTRLVLKDSMTGAVVANRRFSLDYAPIATVYVPDAGSGPAIGVIGRTADGKVRLTLKDAQTFVLVRNISFSKNYKPLAVTVVPDANSSGADEIVVLGIGAANDMRVQAKDAATGQQVLNRGIPGN